MGSPTPRTPRAGARRGHRRPRTNRHPAAGGRRARRAAGCARSEPRPAPPARSRSDVRVAHPRAECARWTSRRHGRHALRDFPGRSTARPSVNLVHRYAAGRWRPPRPACEPLSRRRCRPFGSGSSTTTRRSQAAVGEAVRAAPDIDSSAWPERWPTACPSRPGSTSSCATSSSTAGPKGSAPGGRPPASAAAGRRRPVRLRPDIDRPGRHRAWRRRLPRQGRRGRDHHRRHPDGRRRRGRVHGRPAAHGRQRSETALGPRAAGDRPGDGRGHQRRDRSRPGPVREDGGEPPPSAVRPVRGPVTHRAGRPRPPGGLGRARPAAPLA